MLEYRDMLYIPLKTDEIKKEITLFFEKNGYPDEQFMYDNKLFILKKGEREFVKWYLKELHHLYQVVSKERVSFKKHSKHSIFFQNHYYFLTKK
ncbi:hypothetical protein JXR93_01860 [bacterium]|nr:hypothetical protein [bacterium]